MSIRSHLADLRKDWRAEIFQIAWILKHDLGKAWWSWRVRTVGGLRGVTFGKGVLALGPVHFHRATLATIRIGDGCLLNSSPSYNMVGVNRDCRISAMTEGARIEIGEGTGLSGTVIAAFREIRIGRHVKCGANTTITDSDWHPEDPRSGTSRPVVIGDHVWLGLNVTVLKGVTIGENSLIGAGSVVASDIPPNVVAAGIPCRVIAELPPGKRPGELEKALLQG